MEDNQATQIKERIKKMITNLRIEGDQIKYSTTFTEADDMEFYAKYMTPALMQ